MRCNSCGNMLQENACICDKCGAFCGVTVSVPSKKEYFSSGSCSKKSKQLTVIGWVLVVVLAFLLAFNTTTAAMQIIDVLNKISECESLEEVFSLLEEMGGSSMGVSESELEELGKSDSDEIIRSLRTAVLTGLILIIVIEAAVIILSVFTVWKKSFKCAIWALVLSALFVVSYLALACTIAIAIFAYSWSNEYKAYCINPNNCTSQNFNFS